MSAVNGGSIPGAASGRRVLPSLAASVWTKDIDTALTVTRRVRAGRFWVNCIMAGGPEMPLGGFRQSGWGREAGIYGVEEYTQVKSVHVETGKRSHWIR